MENRTEVSQKTKNKITIEHSNPTAGCVSAKTIIRKDTVTSMFLAVLLKIARTWKPS